MAHSESRQLVSYIAAAAPATRRPADGREPFLRAEVGFTPAWYRQHLNVDFGRRWHTDPAVRRESVLGMHALLDQRFPGMRVWVTSIWGFLAIWQRLGRLSPAPDAR